MFDNSRRKGKNIFALKISKELSVILSANALPGKGGQGLNFQHMIQAYLQAGPESMRLFSQGPYGDTDTTVVNPSKISKIMSETPYLRKFRDLHVALGDKHFDSYVAKNLSDCSFFQGATGQSLDSIKKAKMRGAWARLDVITIHAEAYFTELTEECEIFTIKPTMRSSVLDRMLEEYAEADDIRVMSDVARRMFIDRGISPEKVFSANPPLDWDAFPSHEVIEQKNPQNFVVAYAGLLEPAKGFHYLIKAFKDFNDPKAELHLWGSPGARPVADFMKKAINDDARIKMKPGSIRQLGYENAFGNSSVLVHPSLADGFGYVVAEAMACGKPVIVTENTGAADLVRDGENGFIVPIRDNSAILEKLEILRNSPDLLQSMGQEARKAVQCLTLENFSRKLRQGD